MIQIYFELDIMLTICLQYAWSMNTDQRMRSNSTSVLIFHHYDHHQVFKAIDPKQNSSSSAEVQALKNQLHEKEKYIAQIEVKTNKKQCQLKLVFISIVRFRTGWEYHQNLIKTCYY